MSIDVQPDESVSNSNSIDNLPAILMEFFLGSLETVRRLAITAILDKKKVINLVGGFVQRGEVRQ